MTDQPDTNQPQPTKPGIAQHPAGGRLFPPLPHFVLQGAGYWALLAALLAYVLFWPVVQAQGDNIWQWFSPRFFVDALIAQSILAGKAPSLLDTQPTTGFSPLWTAVLALGGLLTGSVKSLGFAVYVRFISFICLGFSLRLFLQLAQRLFCPHRPVLYLCGAYFAYMASRLAMTGTSIVLAIPLILWCFLRYADFLKHTGWRTGLFLGLSFSAVILARFDAALLVIALVVSASMVDDRFEREDLNRFINLKALPALLLGLAPVALWAAYALYLHGSVVPADVRALMLKRDMSLNTGVFAGLFVRPVQLFRVSPAPILIIGLPVLVIMCTWIGGLKRQVDEDFKPHWRDVLFTAFLVFPVLYYLVYAFVSSWPLSDTDYYPLVLCAPLVLVRVLSSGIDVLKKYPERVFVTYGFSVVVLMSLVMLVLQGMTSPFGRAPLSNVQIMAGFAAKNPGVYALGGKEAGLFALLSGQPVFHTEGKAAGRNYFAQMKASDTHLTDWLERNGASYYISIDPPTDEACVFAEEPDMRRAGNKTYRLSEWVCKAAMFEQVVGRGNILRIYDVQKLIEGFKADKRASDAKPVSQTIQ